MRSEHPPRLVLTGTAAVAKALATAVLSLAVGVAICLGLLYGGAALAVG